MIIQPSEGINKANYFGSCATAAATAAKTVTIDGFMLEPGARVSVYFSNMNTAASPTLNVSGTGAYTIWFEYSDFYNYNALHELCEFVFVDGGTQSYWMYVGHPSSTLRNDAIGYTEYGTVARAAHSAGSYISWKDNFYKVSAAIAAGDTLADGTNLTKATVGDVLASANSTISSLNSSVSSLNSSVTTLNTFKNSFRFYNRVDTFSGGIVNLSFSSLAISSRPNIVLLTPYSAGVLMLYYWDGSSSYVQVQAYAISTVIKVYDGALRYGMMIKP